MDRTSPAFVVSESRESLTRHLRRQKPKEICAIWATYKNELIYFQTQRLRERNWIRCQLAANDLISHVWMCAYMYIGHQKWDFLRSRQIDKVYFIICICINTKKVLTWYYIKFCNSINIHNIAPTQRREYSTDIYTLFWGDTNEGISHWHRMKY